MPVRRQSEKVFNASAAAIKEKESIQCQHGDNQRKCSMLVRRQSKKVEVKCVEVEVYSIGGGGVRRINKKRRRGAAH